MTEAEYAAWAKQFMAEIEAEAAECDESGYAERIGGLGGTA